jgi:hypothetical protein
MRRKHMRAVKWGTAFILVLCYFNTPSAKADYIFDDVETLRGITSLYVYVHNLPPDLEEFGFTREKIQSNVVEKLEAADIQVLSYNACCETPGAPYLFVGIGMLRDTTSARWTATVHIELRQVVNLEREPDVSYHATTWMRGETIFVDNQNAASEVQNLLEGWIKMFTYDFSLANK